MKRGSLSSTSNWGPSGGSLSPLRSRSPSPTRQEPAPAHEPQTGDATADQTPLDQPIATTPAPHGLGGVMPIAGMVVHPDFIAQLLEDVRLGRPTDPGIVQRHYPMGSLRRMVHNGPEHQPTFCVCMSEQPLPPDPLAPSGRFPTEALIRIVHWALNPSNAITTPEQARDLRQLFQHCMLTSRLMRTLTLPHFPTVLLCALRWQATARAGTPTSLPLDRLVDWQVDSPSGQARLPLLVWVQALMQAVNSIPDDNTACQTLLTLGIELLRMAFKETENQAQRQTLMDTSQCIVQALVAAPQCIVQALRLRMQRSADASAPVAKTLRLCFDWVARESDRTTIPWLAELYFTVAQADRHNQDAWLDPIGLYPGTVIDALARADQTVADQLVKGLDLLIELMPDPWNQNALRAPSTEDVTRALHFLADYPHPPVGFVPEVLDHLQALQLDVQQQALLHTCRENISSYGQAQPGTQRH